MTIYLLCSTEENIIEVWSDKIIFWDEILLSVFDDSGNPVKQKWERELEQMNDEQFNSGVFMELLRHRFHAHL